eukprot:gnl/Chilomastix_caulleri/622.p1 GENE.gnl/Chilomastix_caulleri/622~~gnl/Chilomastix_caulleri/622.p1  ORF type:complete len:168 (+),score=60.40 gnl/Chilomastix_caulleri/622:173-676(+)
MQEKKLQMDIKKAAAQNQIEVCKIMAKDIVRTRAYGQRFLKMRAQLQAVNLRMQTLVSTQQMSQAMAGCTSAMTKLNAQMNIPALNQIIKEFAKSNEMMEMKQETIEDAIDDVLGIDGEEADADEIVGQVFDELGISLGGKMATTGASKTAEPAATDDVAARLDSLK